MERCNDSTEPGRKEFGGSNIARSTGFELSKRRPLCCASDPRGAAVARVTTATAIYRELHAAIVAMEMTPGTPLNEKVLTERFGVSRTPVREALIRLVEDGLVDVFPQSGTFVARIPVALIPEAVVIRQALEGATVERAAAKATVKDIERLDEILARQQFFADRQNMSAFHEADEAFHEAIAGISGHPGIWNYLKPVKVQIDRARRMTLPALGPHGACVWPSTGSFATRLKPMTCLLHVRR